jgi:hypothetical protein
MRASIPLLPRLFAHERAVVALAAHLRIEERELEAGGLN